VAGGEEALKSLDKARYFLARCRFVADLPGVDPAQAEFGVSR
jgi:hypothetical protein